MLLFGGTLSPATSSLIGKANASQLPESSVQGSKNPAVRDGEIRPSPLTPHSDALHRLTNHELRLLEELERTRSKLQSEWRLKLAEYERQQPEAMTAVNVTVPIPITTEELARRLAIPRELIEGSSQVATWNQRPSKLVPDKKSRLKQDIATSSKASSIPDPGLPRIVRSKLDIMPILTTTGDTPFEIGLAPTGADPQHVLPIFRLPAVNVNGAARAIANTTVETLEEDRERKQASEALGLSIDEIEQLEASLKGQGTETQDPRRTNQLAAGQDVGYTQQKQSMVSTAARKHGRGRGDPRALGVKKAKRGRELSRSDSLRSELESALYNVQHLTRLVKNDITSAQRICPASELRTKLYFKRWGREKVENIFRRLLYNFQGVAMERWKRVVAFEKQQEKMQAYLIYKGSKKLSIFLQNWSQRKLRQAWTKWWSDYAHQKALERAQLEAESIQTIQRAWRGYRGRLFFRLVKAQRLLARQIAAAIKLQRIFRGSIARKFLRLKRLNKRRQLMAIRIQTTARRYLARKLVARMRYEKQINVAATKLQAIYRGRKARRNIAHHREVHRLTTAAIRIQRRYRGRLGRAKYIRRQIERHRNRAVTKIQNVARGWLARRALRRLREEDRKEKLRRHKAAIQIQKVYRGHRARLATELKLVALREKNRWRAQAATRIQKLVRCRQAKHRVEALRRERFVELVRLARLWVEYWSDDEAKWFYYNGETGESLWAPPSTGYTKADTRLVLQDGRVIEDPGDEDIALASKASILSKPSPLVVEDNHAKDEEIEEESDDDDDRLCIECEEEDARRKCDQCEDFFCDSCFEKLHQTAKRRQHTWKAVGATRCIECEKMKATRWCEECQDPYCLGCFTIIHSKGNKSAHKWVDMATFKKANRLKQQQLGETEGENAQTYEEYVRSAEYQYVAEAVEEPDDWQAPGAATSAWVQLVDASSGLPYYYNTLTGESRWA